MTNAPQGGLPDATQSVQSTEAMQLLRGHSAAGCEIRPAWDGSGDYVLWIWHIAGGRAQWHGRTAAISQRGASRGVRAQVRGSFGGAQRMLAIAEGGRPRKAMKHSRWYPPITRVTEIRGDPAAPHAAGSLVRLVVQARNAVDGADDLVVGQGRTAADAVPAQQ